MGPEIEMSYPVPRRRVLNLLKLRRAALRIFDFAGAVCVLANVCIGGPAWSAVVLVSLWLVWTNLLARPLVEDGAAERLSLSVCALVLTIELVFGGSYTGIVLPVLLACTLVLLSAVYYLGRRRSLMPLLRLLALAVLDIAAALCGLLPLNLPASITLMALSLAAALPALFLRRSEVMAELKKRLHR